ncbi:EpsG family protein [Burkholderia sp. PU8-34]
MKITISQGGLAFSVSKKLLQPSAVVFILLSAAILSVMVLGDRSLLLDQDNYINYFKFTDIDWFKSLWSDSSSLLNFAASTMTEEIGWHVWVLAINSIGFDAEVGVRITVVALNAAMIAALWNTRRPIFALCLWAIIPVGLATMGLFQIRQGMALTIAMYMALRWKRPGLGALVAATVHTTFAFPALFLLIARLTQRRGPVVSAVTSMSVGVLLALASRILFANFGGRRVAEYRDLELTFNAAYVVALTVYMIVPMMILYHWKIVRQQQARDFIVNRLAVMHLGLISFLVTAFFVFPFAMSRIGYYAPVMVAFLLPEVRVKHQIGLWLASLVMMMVMYDVVKNFFSGVYSYFL